MVKSDVKPVKKVVYVCWNDAAHDRGVFEWESFPLPQDTVMCPICNEVVRVTQKL